MICPPALIDYGTEEDAGAWLAMLPHCLNITVSEYRACSLTPTDPVEGEGRMDKLRVLDLFSGIGGFSLGLERTGGFETVAFCEIEEFPRRVLAKHWPNVPCYRDVRELTAAKLAADGVAVDVICGGFPCQDISVAGTGEGLAGERSGLWSEIARLVGELAPRYVIVENVAALLSRGLGDVLGDLASLGYDAEWHCIPASAVGAPHGRDRIWVVAYPEHRRVSVGRRDANAREALERCERVLGDDAPGLREQTQAVVAHADSAGCVEQCPAIPIPAQLTSAKCGGWWGSEPAVGRVAHGVPDRVGQLKGYGNAVVPQIPELIGNAILASLNRACSTSRDPARRGEAQNASTGLSLNTQLHDEPNATEAQA